MRILSGMRSTGRLHLGNYITLEKWKELQDSGHECYYFVADWHALTSHKEDVSQFEFWTMDIVKTYVSCGLDPEVSVLFVQSAIKEHSELFLLLSNLVSVSRLQRMPTYKEQKSEMSDRDLSSAGFMMYPVLQSADVLMYRAHGVPIGEDQLYHIELTREIARRFNSMYGEVFPEPEPILSKFPKLPGTDGRKMSKSYDNFILIDNDAESLWKKLAPMMTDPARKRRNDPGDPEKCPVWDYHKAFTHKKEELEWVVEGCTEALIGCLECKKLLFENLVKKLNPVWEKMRELDNNEENLRKMISEGNRKAKAFAGGTMEMVRNAMSMRW
jgi:tryptophanyl-tRNA synthetase